MSVETWRDAQKCVRVTSDHHEFDITYQDIGTGDVPTVFLHGIPTWSYLYRDTYEAAQRSILLDLPGYGFTEHVGDGGYDRSIAAQTEYLTAFFDELGFDNIQLVGHDIGGGIAMRIAVQTDVVDRLVLSNSVSYDSWPIEAIVELGLPNRTRNMTYKEVDKTLRSFFSNGMYNEDRVTTEFVDGMIEPFLHRPVTDLSRNAISLNTNHTLELNNRLEEIAAPTLLLWGVPGSGQHVGFANRLAEAIPTTKKRYLSRSYHWVMQECPSAYRESLAEFLQ